MDLQQALLAKIIRDRDLATAVNARITPEFFNDEQWRTVYEYLLKHWRKFSTAPDLDSVKHDFPSHEWPVLDQDISYYIHGLLQRRKKAILTEGLNAAATFLHSENDPESIDSMETTLRDSLMRVRLETSPTLDVNFAEGGGEVSARLDQRRKNPGYLRGISTGVRGIDYVTGGLQPEQLIVIIGLPKAMKSSTLLWMAMNVHAEAKRPLFLGFEMSNVEQEDRLTSLYGSVGLSDVMNGTLTLNQLRQIRTALQRLTETNTAFICSVDMANAMTVSGIQAKILEYDPDVVLIDGAYLMQSELPKAEPGSPQALADIARNLKKLAQAQRIPIVVTTQADQGRSRRGLTAASAMYTQAWRQSADVLLGVERLDPEADDFGQVMVRFKVLASRSGPRAETLLAWNWSQGTVHEVDPSIYRTDDADEED